MSDWKKGAFMLCMVALPGFGNLITNGSFELGYPDYNVWGFQDLFAPNAYTITGWTVGAGSVDYIGPYWQAPHGSRSLDLSGTYAQGTISQTFPTVVGLPHKVTFALAGNPDHQSRTTTVRVWALSGTISSQDFNYVVNGQTYPNMGWTYVTWWFTPQSSLTTLGFTSLDPSYDEVWEYSFGPAIDDVRVEPIPEPATLALVGLGLIAAGFLRRRR